MNDYVVTEDGEKEVKHDLGVGDVLKNSGSGIKMGKLGRGWQFGWDDLTSDLRLIRLQVIQHAFTHPTFPKHLLDAKNQKGCWGYSDKDSTVPTPVELSAYCGVTDS